MILDMFAMGGGQVLSGSLRGKAAFAKLLSAIAKEPLLPEPAFLDFRAVDVATASFLRETVLALRDFARGRRSSLYPVVANANESIRDEIEELVRFRGDAIIVCNLDKRSGQASSAALIGELDPKQKMTFEILLQRGETDASELMRDYGETEGTKHPTAWNNRLSSLSSMGLIVEQSQGRTKRYRPLFDEVE